MSLPRDETAFLGRRADITQIERRFDGGARLVTIVGLGGIGKTRLALAIARERLARDEKAVVLYVPLGEARTLEAAVREIAARARVPLRAESQARGALDSVAKALAKKGATFLVLDNTEQLGPSAGDFVSAILDGADSARVLATAREPIGVRGEIKVALGPLDEASAIELLRDRAAEIEGAPPIADEEARAIVRRVDALPLAIELAASRLEVLSPTELLERLAVLDVLTDATGGAPPTHRTMRATLDWSWDLLSEVERRALVQASAFAAPFGVDAAEEVIVLGASEAEVLDVLESLVKQSLLFRIADGGRARIGMFDTVRRWAREKLTDEDVHARHARHHLEEAESSAARAYGSGAVRALDRLEELLPELLSAFGSSSGHAPAVAARIVLALSDLLLFRRLAELRAELFEAGKDAAERSGDEALLGRLLVANARVTLEVGRMEDAERELRRALELAERTGDDLTRAEATRSLGWALTALGRMEEAETALATAAVMHRRHGSARGSADAHVATGILRALQGRPAEGLAELRAALAIHVEHGDVIRQEKVLGFAGLVGHDAREVARGLPRDVLARAPRSSIQVLPIHLADLVNDEGEAGRSWQDGIELYRQGAAADERGDVRGAVDSFDRAVIALDRAGVRRGLPVIHAHAAAVLALDGDIAEADARLARAQRARTDEDGSAFAVAVLAAVVDLAKGADRGAARDLLSRATRAEVATMEVTTAARVLRRVLDASAPAAPRSQQRAMSEGAGAPFVVGRDARWMVLPGGARLELVRYGPVRRLLDRLVGARLDAPGAALSAEALIEAGWPGERMRHSAGLLRVYSAVRRLRRLGLEPLLVTRDDGYLIDPNVNVVRQDDT